MGGKRVDSVSSYPADADSLLLYDRASELLATQPLPRILGAGRTESRLFVACLDGSGQDYRRAEAVPTNVGAIHAELERSAAVAQSRVGTAYVAGPGTQRNPILAGLDNALGYTADDRVEEMYELLAEFAKQAKRENQDADITIAAVGYSRGAIEAVMLTRLADRYGILDPDSLRFSRDANGDLKVESNRPPLVPPGKTAQVLALFDPVSTGMDRDFDLRPPPSVISGVSFWARDERRALFPHRSVVDLGLSEDGRFAGILVPGAHSDVGGGNALNGLEIRVGNLARGYINGLSDTPLLPMRPEPADPALNAIHRSHQALLGAFEIGSSPAGSERRRREELCVVVDPCRDAEPRDEALAARFGLTDLRIQAAAPVTASRLDETAHAGHSMYRSARDGIARLDHQHGVVDEAGSDRAAAALAASAREAGIDRIGHVVLGHDRQRLFAVDTDDLHSLQRRIAYVDVATAREQAIEVSTRRFEAVAAHQEPAADLASRHAEVEQAREARTRSLAH